MGHPVIVANYGIDLNLSQNNEALQRHADERDGVLREIANWVHDSVPVSKVHHFNYTSGLYSI